MALVAASISSWSFLLGMRSFGQIVGWAKERERRAHHLTRYIKWWARCALPTLRFRNSLRQFLQAQPDQLRGFGLLARAARGGGNRGSRLRLAVTEIDQRGDRVRHRARRALIVHRPGEMHDRRIDVGKRRC